MIPRRLFLQSLAGTACGLMLPARARPQDPTRGNLLPAGDAETRVPTPGDAHVREAWFYEPLADRRIRCRTCPHQCLLAPGETGICRAKMNLEGKHYSLSFGNPCAVNVDPVEKKPLFHFLPGATAFSLAVAGCNFRCLNCQNWEISQVSPRQTRNYELPPAEVVRQAGSYDCRAVAFTYSEPSSFYEYGVETSTRARAAGLRSIWVSNGYLAAAPLDRLCRTLDAASINLKSFDDRIYADLNGGHLQPVQETLMRMKSNGIWLEVINLVIPTYTDNLEMIRRMCDWYLTALGPDTPLHFSRFNPLYKLVHLPPTPVEFLVRARETARAAGLHHVYIGNVPGLAEDTICPGCGRTVVTRKGFRVVSLDLENGRCRGCHAPVAGVWN